MTQQSWSPTTASEQPTHQIRAEEPADRRPQYAAQPKRSTAQKIEKLPSGGAAWLQAVSVAAIALMMFLVLSYSVLQFVKAKAALYQYQQQQQSQTCGVNPNTGLVECR